MTDTTPATRNRSTREIPPAIRRRYGYPHPYRSRTDDLERELDELRRRMERLERAGLLAGEPGR